MKRKYGSALSRESEAEKAHVRALMQPVYAPGKIAGWIAPPARGIDGKPVAYEYVRV